MSTDWTKLFKDIGYDVTIPAAPIIAPPPELPAAKAPEPTPVIESAAPTPQRTTMNNKPVYVVGGIVICLICVMCFLVVPALQAPSVLTQPVRGDPEYGWIAPTCTVLGLILIAVMWSLSRKRGD